jgi:hypothetical protein
VHAVQKYVHVGWLLEQPADLFGSHVELSLSALLFSMFVRISAGAVAALTAMCAAYAAAAGIAC